MTNVRRATTVTAAAAAAVVMTTGTASAAPTVEQVHLSDLGGACVSYSAEQ
jgi:hypothetical protein